MSERVGFDTSKNDLLCLMVLTDEIGQYFTSHLSKAFWRAFIVQDRQSHHVLANFRFRYGNHDNWYTVEPKDQTSREATRDLLVKDLRFMLTTVLRKMFEFECEEEHIMCFYPPQPEDAEHTLQWLLDQDLIVIVKEKSTS